MNKFILDISSLKSAVELINKTMKETLKWRLSKLPSVDEITTLLEKKIITQEEARQVLFNSETEEEKSIEDYKKEIKFLKEIIEKLSDRDKIVEVIRTVEHHYPQAQWIYPYVTWSNGGICSTYCNAGTDSITLTGTSMSNTTDCGSVNTSCSFSQIV